MNKHDSFGMLSIAKFSGQSQFFGSDLIHSGGVQLTISRGIREQSHSRERYHTREHLIQINLSYNQFVDAITNGMNTIGVPCTLKYIGNTKVPQIEHCKDKKLQFSKDMAETQQEYVNKILAIEKLLDGNIGKKKVDEIKHSLQVLSRHITSNTDFVMNNFTEAMEDTVTEAKHSIAGYLDNKVHSLGLETLKDQLKIEMR